MSTNSIDLEDFGEEQALEKVGATVAFMRLLIDVVFTRCFNGLLCISCMVLDLGCLSPLL